MTTTRLPVARCARCEHRFSDYDAANALTSDGERALSCPRCGSRARHFEVWTSGTITLHETISAKARSGPRGKPFFESLSGDNYHRNSGTWRKIRRIIDRAQNRYEERVETTDGQVIRDISVPLDEHRGHGSDNSQPKTHP